MKPHSQKFRTSRAAVALLLAAATLSACGPSDSKSDDSAESGSSGAPAWTAGRSSTTVAEGRGGVSFGWTFISMDPRLAEPGLPGHPLRDVRRLCSDA